MNTTKAYMGTPLDKFLVIKFSSSITDFLKIPSLFSFDVSANGELVIYSSNETGNVQLHLMHVKTGSKPKQLTSGQDPVFRGRISPRGDRIVFPQDKDGNETFHMYLASIEGGKDRQITETPYRMWGGFDWHPNSREIARTVAAKDKCGLEIINVDTGECFMLKDGTPPIGTVRYSHDGKWIACDALASVKSEEILIVNREDPSDVITYSVKEDSRDNEPSWSPSDKRLAFTSDANGSRQVVIQDFQGKDRKFLELDAGEEVTGQPAWSPRGEKVYYVVSKQSRTTVHGHAIDGRRGEALPLPQGSVYLIKVSNDGRIFALHSSMNSPWQIYVQENESKQAVPLVPRNYSFDLNRLAKPEFSCYKSFDGHKIYGWYMPAVSGTAPHAAVLYVHGGPWMQVADEWLDSDFLHCLSQSGFAVFAPNFRGSTGYGAEFQRMDIGDLGGGDLEDIIMGAEWLRKQSGIDRSRIAIMGASYGGYITLLALTKKPHVFAAGVALVPITDWLEMHELEDATFRAYDEMLWGGPVSERKELLGDRSPMTHISRIKSPVMIMAGRGDARCPIQPIEKFANKLKEMNHPFELILEEKAGHITTLFRWEEKIPIFTGIIRYLKKVLA